MTSGKPLVLLVDDDDAHLLVSERALRRSNLGVDVQVARNGNEALTALGVGEDPIFRHFRMAPAIVMLDLSMPGMSGWDVLRRIRAERQNVPVVVVSSSGRPDDVRRSYEMGANSYVVKRFEAERPGGYMVDAARYWVELNEPPSPAAAF